MRRAERGVDVMAERTAVGILLGGALIAALRGLAQRDASARRFAADTEDDRSRERRLGAEQRRRRQPVTGDNREPMGAIELLPDRPTAHALTGTAPQRMVAGQVRPSVVR